MSAVSAGGGGEICADEGLSALFAFFSSNKTPAHLFLSLSADLMVYSFKISRPVARRRSAERSGGSGRNVVTKRSITVKQGVLSPGYHSISLLILNGGNL